MDGRSAWRYPGLFGRPAMMCGFDCPNNLLPVAQGKVGACPLRYHSHDDLYSIQTFSRPRLSLSHAHHTDTALPSKPPTPQSIRPCMFVQHHHSSCMLPSLVRDALVANLLLYPPDVGRVDLVPRRHVLLHALGQARLLAAGEGGARLGDAAFEALFVDVLQAGDGDVSRGGGRTRLGGPGVPWEGRDCLLTSIRVRALDMLVA